MSPENAQVCAGQKCAVGLELQEVYTSEIESVSLYLHSKQFVHYLNLKGFCDDHQFSLVPGE